MQQLSKLPTMIFPILTERFGGRAFDIGTPFTRIRVRVRVRALEL
jgi:hypothetical protein